MLVAENEAGGARALSGVAESLRDAAALRVRLAEEGLYSMDKLQKIDALLAEYRSANASADATATAP